MWLVQLRKIPEWGPPMALSWWIYVQIWVWVKIRMTCNCLFRKKTMFCKICLNIAMRYPKTVWPAFVYKRKMYKCPIFLMDIWKNETNQPSLLHPCFTNDSCNFHGQITMIWLNPRKSRCWILRCGDFLGPVPSFHPFQQMAVSTIHSKTIYLWVHKICWKPAYDYPTEFSLPMIFSLSTKACRLPKWATWMHRAEVTSCWQLLIHSHPFPMLWKCIEKQPQNA